MEQAIPDPDILTAAPINRLFGLNTEWRAPQVPRWKNTRPRQQDARRLMNACRSALLMSGASVMFKRLSGPAYAVGPHVGWLEVIHGV
jgi:hypothetical protein